jgi:membrane protease YdiL (CAAX protease family)
MELRWRRMTERAEITAAARADVVAGRTILVGLGIGVGIAIPVGLATGFVLPRAVPALGSADWLGTIIAAEAYGALVIGHAVAFGGFAEMHQRLRVTRAPWRDIGLACVVFLALWSALLSAFALLHERVALVGAIGAAVVKIGSLYGRLDGASPALLVSSLVQPIFITSYFEEILFRGSMFSWLRPKLGARRTILVTSVAFALYHPMLLLWPIAFLFAIAGGWIRERTQSVTPFIIVHALNSVLMIGAAYIVSGWRVIE